MSKSEGLVVCSFKTIEVDGLVVWASKLSVTVSAAWA